MAESKKISLSFLKNRSSINSIVNQITGIVAFCSILVLGGLYLLFDQIQNRMSAMEEEISFLEVTDEVIRFRQDFLSDVIRIIEEPQVLIFLRSGSSTRQSLTAVFETVLFQLPQEVSGMQLVDRKNIPIYSKNFINCIDLMMIELDFIGDRFNQEYGESYGILNLCIDKSILEAKLLSRIPKLELSLEGRRQLFIADGLDLFKKNRVTFPRIYYDVKHHEMSPYFDTYHLSVTIIFIIYCLLIRFLVLYIVKRELLTPLKKISNNIGSNQEIEPHNQSVFHEIAKIDSAVFRLNHFESGIKILAHEVRTPLAKVSILLARLSGDNPSNREAAIVMLNKFRPEILLHIASIEALVKDILQLNRSETLQAAPTLLYSLINNAIKALDEKQLIDVDILNQVDEKLKVIVEELKIIRVFINILSNALSCMDKPGEILIKTLAHSEKEIAVVIQNTGSFIPKDTPIFEPFVSLRKNGFGLGLSICKKIINEHGGAIWWESNEKERRTMFIFTIKREFYVVL